MSVNTIEEYEQKAEWAKYFDRRKKSKGKERGCEGDWASFYNITMRERIAMHSAEGDHTRDFIMHLGFGTLS